MIINIADSLKNDSTAVKLAKELITALTSEKWKYQFKNVEIGDLKEDAINIRIIKNISEYKDGNDEHLRNIEGYQEYLVHHITTSNFKIKPKSPKNTLSYSNGIDVILKELFIKNDIKNRQITITDWNFGEWIFLDREEIKSTDETSLKDGKRKERKYYYRIMKVFKDGTLDFECFESDNIMAFKKYRRYLMEFTRFLKNDNNHKDERAKFKALIVSKNGDINYVEDTPKFTIQDVERIGNDLRLEGTSKTLSKESIITLINDFLDEETDLAEKYRLRFENLIGKLNTFKLKFSKKELLDKMAEAKITAKGKNHISGRFCDFYKEHTGDVLKAYMRRSDLKEELLGSKLDIFYHQSLKQAEYFVGKKSEGVGASFQNATNIRKIKSVYKLNRQPSKIVFKELLDTLNVDFVKHKDLTVMPFPFKYLREFTS